MIRQAWPGFFLALVFLLPGCSAVPEKPVTDVQAGDAGLLQITPWGFNGRVSVVHEDNGWHATLQWRERGSGFHLKVAGPLGQGAFEINGNASGVVLKDGSGRHYRDSDVDALFRTVTGIELPVSGLRYWVRGLPVPGVESGLERNAAGHVAEIRQAGWHLVYDRFKDFQGYTVPGRLKMAREGISVRLVIDDWWPGPVRQAAP